MAKSESTHISHKSVDKNGAKQNHLKVLRLTKHLAKRGENFCEVMAELGTPLEMKEIQRHPVPVMICMRVAAAKVYGFGDSAFAAILCIQLRFSYLIQEDEVLRKLGIQWRPSFYAGKDPSALTDSVEENATRDRTLALLDEVIEQIEQEVELMKGNKVSCA